MNISVETFEALRAQNPDLLVIDVREPDEVALGKIPGAQTIAHGDLEQKIAGLTADHQREIVLYCAMGGRSARGAEALQRLGYEKVHSLVGGYSRWMNARNHHAPGLTERQRERYHRHILLPEVEESGQLKLLQSKIALVGVGGLGCPAALYLAAAGVGTLGLIDDDKIDRSNLQRQVLYADSEIGTLKVDAAQRRLNELNPEVKILKHPLRLTRQNALDILQPYDLVVNGSDNFPTRYLVNDACYFLKKPLIDGAIFRFEGQVSVHWPDQGPCYRCLYPEPPPREHAPSCTEAGVFGVLPGIVGSLQAVEAIKLLLHLGENLVGRLLMFDSKSMRFREMKVRRDPACPLCGNRPTVTTLIDYENFCGA